MESTNEIDKGIIIRYYAMMNRLDDLTAFLATGQGPKLPTVPGMEEEGYPAIIYAILHSNYDMVSLLIEKTDLWRERDSQYHTGLHWAVRRGEEKMVEALLDAGLQADDQNDLGQSCVYMSALEGQVDCLRMLLSHHCDVNLRALDGSGALHAAVYGKPHQIELIRILIAYGADIHLQDGDQEMALHWALREEDREVVTYLLAQGCRIEDMALVEACEDKEIRSLFPPFTHPITSKPTSFTVPQRSFPLRLLQ